ncbi:hypothetical protein AB0C65_36030 [Nocardia sp. NPDC048505]|uniref:hypothetical protein n=1 Tax=Nocardia sp. NPDC048505 TaxID=3155756 RepID=UPI0033C5F3E8
MTDTDRERQLLAREFEQIHPIGSGPGFSLGMWSGRGDHAHTRPAAREAAGHRALTELDELIDTLIEYRARLAHKLEHDSATAAAADPDPASAELAAVLAGLPADTRPGPPTVERYDDLLPSRRRARGSATAPEREKRASQQLSVRRLVRQVIDPGEVFEVGDLLARLAELGIAMTPDKTIAILDYWAARSQLTLVSPGIYRRPNEPDDAA